MYFCYSVDNRCMYTERKTKNEKLQRDLVLSSPLHIEKKRACSGLFQFILSNRILFNHPKSAMLQCPSVPSERYQRRLHLLRRLEDGGGRRGRDGDEEEAGRADSIVRTTSPIYASLNIIKVLFGFYMFS